MKRLLTLVYVMAISGAVLSPAAAHCGAGQDCEYAPFHHCPGNQPCGELGSAVTAMNKTVKAISSDSGGVIRVYKDKVGLAPLGSAPVIPPLARPPGAAPPPLPASAIPDVRAAGPVAVPATPGQPAPPVPPAITPQQLENIPRGVAAAARGMLDVQAADKVAAQTGGTAQAELLQVHAMKLGQNFEALKRYNTLLQQAEDLSRTGDISVSPPIWTDLERVRAFTQGVVDTSESPAQ